MSARYTGGLVYNAPGGWSGKFDGSGDNLSVASNANLAIGTGQYTAELWIYFNSISTLGEFFECTTTGNTGCFTFYFNGSNALQVVATGGAGATTITWTPVAGQWYHIAASRDSSNNQRVFINGVLFGTATSTNNYGQNGFRLFTTTLNGYVSNARLVVGSCLYTTNFTPPTGALTAVSGTQLLLCNQPTFVDKSANNFTVTVTSDAVVSTVNPFPTSALPNPALGGAGNGVYTMSQYAALKAANLWPAFDPFYKNVTLNLHGNGTNAAQNNTFLDSSGNNYPITRSGNATQGTFSPYGPNWSNYLASGDSLGLSSSISQGSTWTIECWYNLSASGNNILSYQSSGGDYWFGIYANTINYNYGANSRTFSFTSAVNTWYHIALVNNAGSLTCYVNGTQVGTTQTGPSSSTLNKLGGYQAGYYFAGYISNFRVTNTAVYTGSFTPSTAPLTAISGTQLLICQSNRFVDNSASPYTITPTGASVQRFSPFSPTTAYSASTIGGSAYFDGSSANIITTNTVTTIGTQDFCLEAWVYCFSTTDYACIIGNDTAGGGNGWFIEMGTARGIFIAGPEVSLGSAQYNRWFHVVFCRVSGTYGGFVNGVRQATGTFTNNYSTAVKIGINSYVVGTLNKGTTGYIADGRVTVGSSPYSPSSTTLTVPTAPLTAVTGTVYLASMTNAAVLDNAMMNDLETVGNAQISTSVKKYGTGSMYFDGSGDYLLLPNTPLLDQVGDYTYECWYYRAGSGAGGLDILCLKNVTSMLYIYVDQSSQKFGINQHNVGGFILGTTVTLVNTWYHVAMCRSGSTVRLFVNGIQEASGTYSSNITGTATTTIGGFTSGGYSMNGYLDDLRVTRAARYTANFTPPTSQVQDQ